MSSGIVVPVFRYSVFNFSFLTGGASEETILADNIPVRYNVIGFSGRIHKRNIGTGASFQFIVRGINPSAEDGADFVWGTDLGSTPATTPTTNPTNVPGLVQLSTIITNPQHPMLRVVLKATGGSSAVNCYLVASGDLVMRPG